MENHSWVSSRDFFVGELYYRIYPFRCSKCDSFVKSSVDNKMEILVSVKSCNEDKEIMVEDFYKNLK